MTTEQQEILRVKFATGYLVSDDPGMSMVEAIISAKEGEFVYQRFNSDLGTEIDFEVRVMKALKHFFHDCKCGAKYCEETRQLIREVDAYRAAQAAAIEKGEAAP